MAIRPIDVARKLKISTSALRHYESWGIVPPAERTSSGYRLYTEEHVAYFQCIRSMLPGFGMELTKKTMRLIREKKAEEAFWLVSEQMACLHRDKIAAEKTIRMLESEERRDESDTAGTKRRLTIGEVAAETGVPSSAIRHWEKEGLLALPRDGDNGYRAFDRSRVRQILMIRTLRSAAHPIEVVKAVMAELDHDRVDNARRIARDALSYLNYLNRNQVQGMHDLYFLCRQAGLL